MLTDLFVLQARMRRNGVSRNITVHNLVIYVEIPETSGLDVSCLSSPVVTLGRYEGLSSDATAPEWTRMPTGIPFEIRQPCTAMLDVFEELPFWPENCAVVSIFIFSLHL